MVLRGVYTSLFLVIVMVSSLYAQKVETVRVEIEKEIPGESFSDNRFEIDFWVQAENFSSINVSKTQLLLLKDDTGKDLHKAHKQAIVAYNDESERLAKKGHYRFSTSTESLFKPQDWRAMQDTIGFRASIKSGLVTPASSATKVHVKMKIGYFTKSSISKKDSVEVNVTSLYTTPFILFQGKEVQLDNTSSMSNEEGRFIIYRIPKNEIMASIEKIQVYNMEGKPLKGISGGMGSYEFMVEEKQTKKPVKLILTYVPVSEETITIDKWITLGL